MRLIDVFFYGLFMDRNALLEQGFHPGPSHVASVRDYELRIGQRATLLPRAGQTVWGTVMGLPSPEISALYSEPSVADYRPEAVIVWQGSDSSRAALCYNLMSDDVAETNKSYAAALHDVAVRTGLPASYLRHLQDLST